MTKSDPAGKPAATSPSATAFFGRIVKTAFAAMSPTERKNTLADAMLAADAGGFAAKAHDIMDGKDVDIRQVEDLWDGGPDGVAPHEDVAGGDSGAHEGGKFYVGPEQASSGANASRMARQYSRPAPQGGAQLASEKLGEMLSVKSAIKSLIQASKAQSQQFSVLAAAVNSLIDDTAAVKAIALKAVAKAEKEDASGHETEEEEADEEAAKAESGGNFATETDDEVEGEDEAESDDDKDKTVKAAKSRVAAKSRLRLARARLTKALDAELDNMGGVAKRHRGVASAHAAKAKKYLATAKALQPAATKLASLEKTLRSLVKALPASATENQEMWPASEAKPVGKAVDSGAEADKLAAMQAKIDKSLQGTAMLQGSVADLMNVLGGQSRYSSLPPVAKSAAATAAASVPLLDQVETLFNAGVISRHDVDTASDVCGQIEAIKKGFPLDGAIVKARISRMPTALKTVFDPHSATLAAV